MFINVVNMTEKKLNIGLIQASSSADREKNIKKITAGIHRLADNGADLVVLQELHNTLYFCQEENVDNFDLSETIPGPSTSHFSYLAREHQIVIVASLFEKRAPGIYHNTAVVLDKNGSIAGKYRKMHIPDDPGFYEKFYFTPGDLGFEPIPTSIGTLGVLVCWDQWYPEAARLMTMKGADILIYPTAIGWDRKDTKEEQQRQLDAWMISQRAHAVHNGIAVVSVNRVGWEAAPADDQEGILFWGNSFVCGPQGELLYLAPSDKSDEKIVTLNLKQTETVRRIWPFFRDRRIDSYHDLQKRYLI
jgi:N-carbamoylputrescine amidase